MITPLGQRQIFQTANVEAVRMALEMSEQIQREAARRKAVEDRMAEDQDNVHEVERADGLRTEERKGRPAGEEAGGGEEGEEEAAVAEEAPTPTPEEPEEGRLDFLA